MRRNEEKGGEMRRNEEKGGEKRRKEEKWNKTEKCGSSNIFFVMNFLHRS